MDLETVTQQIEDLIEEKNLRQARDMLISKPPIEVADLINGLSGDNQAIVFRILPRDLAAQTFEYVSLDNQKKLFTTLGEDRFAVVLNEMAADDRTALLEEFPAQASRQLLSLLSEKERAVALTLLGYPENSVGRLMTPDYIAVKEEWTVEEVLEFVRKNGQDSDTLNVLYVVDERSMLIDDLRMRQVLLASPRTVVMQLMDLQFVALKATDDQETAVGVFRKYDRTVLPVVDSQGHMLGIITVDDVLDVVEEEATEDIQKLGAVEVLDNPYIQTPILQLIKKRAGWLVVLFIGEMLTATAMGYFEGEIQRAVVLALFVPLIISSGGNSGSQAATLVIRALALGEITVKDWARVMWREIFSGVSLGVILGTIGFLRITIWSFFGDLYGPFWPLVGLAVGCSLIAVVLWGTLAGALLPLLLKKLGADPATSSAPFVATLVDVTGLVIYFTVSHFILKGTLL